MGTYKRHPKNQSRSCMKLWILHIYVNWKVYERLEHRDGITLPNQSTAELSGH